MLHTVSHRGMRVTGRVVQVSIPPNWHTV
ncbi:hypothetical protein F383_34476 [Gossypium arboreum]|uniref:Uncharacterized protein n=1 Tax=Gossypium arboreum TaxID=29729 RepID=A0A0B0N8Q9_GOSAR|nr:hypothetical protein F383_34476 [Gossypium arboreum]